MKLKILHIIDRVDVESGGPIENLKIHFKLYKKLNVKADLLTVDKAYKIFGEQNNIKTYYISNSFLKYKYSINFRPWLKKNIKNYDAIIVNGLWVYNNLATYLEAQKYKIPYFLFTHGMLDPWFNKRYKIKKIKKYIYWKLVQSRVLQNASGVIFTNNEEYKLAKKSFKPFKVKKIIHSYGTIEKKIKNKRKLLFEFYKKFPGTKNKKIILYIGRFNEKKGCDILIKAFSQIKNFKNLHLLMVGPVQKDNSYVNQLKKLIDEKKINKNVTWTGTLINDYKNLVYNISYVFCFPTHSENFGITIAESLSNKLPVITTNKTNIYKILKKNKIGFITNDNTRNIKKNLEMFLNLSKREYDRYKLNSYKCFQENFNLETNVEKFVSTLKNSIEKFRKKKIG